MPGVPQAVAAPRRPRLLIWLGLAAVVGGVVGAALLYLMSGSADDEAAKKLARAPVGCTTTLQFDRTGTFLFFVETKGSVGDVGGDCPVTDDSYDSTGSNPDVTLTLVDRDDSDVTIDDSTGVSYDAAGFVGSSIQSVQIDEPGTYRLTVDSPDDEFVISVGTDPNEAADSMKTLAMVVLGVGVVLGAGLLLLGKRRRGAAPAPAVPAAWQPQPTWQPQAEVQPQPATPMWPPQAPQPTPPATSDPFGRPPAV